VTAMQMNVPKGVVILPMMSLLSFIAVHLQAQYYGGIWTGETEKSLF